jgi:threonine dehydrogenase-like Zn-dependent dehydrogenase
VGLAVVAGLKLAGAGPIIAADFSPVRRTLAERLGADEVVDPAQATPYASWERVAVPAGVDLQNPFAAMLAKDAIRPCVVFECVGVPGLIQQIFEGAPRETRVVVAGVCMESDRIEPFLGIQKELAVQFALGYSPEEFAATLHHIAEGRIDVDPLITGRVGVDGVPGAFEELRRPERHAKILVEPWR